MCEGLAENKSLHQFILEGALLLALLDLILNDAANTTATLATTALKTIVTAIVKTKARIYIPGETIAEAKQRNKAIQHGFILVLIHIQEKALDPELAKLAATHLKSQYQVHELSTTLTLLKRHLAVSNRFAGKTPSQAEDVILPAIPNRANSPHSIKATIQTASGHRCKFSLHS
jgi:hypothetical protein